jgi:hypothetical protein
MGNGKRWCKLIPVQSILEEVLEDVVAKDVDVWPIALHHSYLPTWFGYLLCLAGDAQKSKDQKRKDDDWCAYFEVSNHGWNL